MSSPYFATNPTNTERTVDKTNANRGIFLKVFFKFMYFQTEHSQVGEGQRAIERETGNPKLALHHQCGA